MSLAGVLILTSAVHFAVVSFLGHPEPGPLIAAAIGLLLLAAVVGAWGVFFSSLFQYQVVSYVLTFAFVFLFFIIDGLEPHLPGLLGRIATQLSFKVHFSRFSWGVVDSRDLVFFLGWIVVGLSAAATSLGGRRMVNVRKPLHWLPTVMLTALLGIVYGISLYYPLTWDWTRDKRYSLSPQAEQVLQTIDEEITIYGFYQRLDPQRKAVEVLLRACGEHSPYLQFEIVDPDRDLGLVERYGVASPRTVVVEMGERRKVLLEPDESPLINAIYRLATGSQPVIYHLLGHGEHRLDSDDRGGYSNFAAVLADQGYRLKPLVLADAPEVPSDADIVIIAAPKLEFGAAEFAAVDEFIHNGGAVLAMLDPGTPVSVEQWCGQYNLDLGDDFIVSADRGRSQFGVDPRVVVLYESDSYGEHALTRGLPGQATFFPFAQSLGRLHAGVVGVNHEWFLKSSRRSWAEQDARSIASGEPQFTEGEDLPGPIFFGVAVEVDRQTFFGENNAEAGPRAARPETPDDPVISTLERMHAPPTTIQNPSIFTQEASSRLVFMGDSDCFANANLSLYGNRDLLLNILGWLARERVLIERRAPTAISKAIILTVGQKELLGWSSLLGWPLLVGLGSVVMVVRHRRRR
ncbi:MAG: Gldg family protein [bacterium]